MSFLLGRESIYRGEFLNRIPVCGLDFLCCMFAYEIDHCTQFHISVTMVNRALNASVGNTQGQFRILSWKCDERVSESVATPFADILARLGDNERTPYMTFDVLETVPELNPFLSHLTGVVNFYFLFHVLRSTWYSPTDLSALLAKDGGQLQNMTDFLVCLFANSLCND